MTRPAETLRSSPVIADAAGEARKTAAAATSAGSVSRPNGEPELAARIRGPAQKRALAGHRPDHHDRSAPPLEHRGQNSSAAVKHPAEVDPNRLLPLLGRDLRQWCGRAGGAAVADQDVDAAELIDCLGHHAAHSVRIGHIGGDSNGLRTPLRRELGRFLEVREVARGQRKPTGRFRERERDLSPDSLAGASDQDRVEVVTHRSWPTRAPVSRGRRGREAESRRR